MPMFSRFCIFVCVWGILLFASGPVDVHAQENSLEAAAITGLDEENPTIGSTVSVHFTAKRGALPAAGVELTITHSGLTDVSVPNGGTLVTNLIGRATVTGTITERDAWVKAEWRDAQLEARLRFNVEEVAEEEAEIGVEYTQAGLEVAGTTGLDVENPIGSTVSVHFVATNDGSPAGGAELTITHSGLTDVSVANGGTLVTNFIGRATVTGTITERNVWVQANWNDADLQARADYCCRPIVTTAAIVVNPPDPKFPLAVGDVFEQVIEIQDATDLASWQMDIAFNPEVLEVVDISEGDFLKQDEGETLFLSEQHPGKIAVRQVRVAEIGAPMSGVSGSGVLVVLSFKFVSFSEALLGIHNVRLSDSSGDRLSYSVTLTPVVATHASTVAADVNQDGKVDILDLIVVASSIGAAQPNLRADVNDDDMIDVLDLIAIAGSPDWGKVVPIVQVREPNAAAPTASVSYLMPETIREWIALAQLKNDGSLLFQRGIANLESLFAARVPSETRLLRNYPNPFNPETWIPYQLSEATDVTVSIYSMNGNLVRTLVLGHQPAGLYQNKSQAAYWDGRNELGERIASGLYFYTLTAGNFTATRKMLVRK